jgi:predicted transcriptional regulator
MTRLLLLSIRTVFANAIFERSKIFEFRRIKPRHGIPGSALIYEPLPVAMITGWIKISQAIALAPADAVDLAGAHDPFSNDYKAYLDSALSPCAFKIVNAQRLPNKIALANLTKRKITPPQSYCYVDQAEITALLPLEFYHSNETRSEDVSTAV